ncbi:hypothetical protein FQN51_004408 [Onygenales sp. PD_10]|nr:hypothetical protein FQN51_004408 [Onygenales sp. PD_10]
MDNFGGGDADAMGFEMPTMANQPPQIFGAYNPDGSPVTPSLPGPIFADDHLTGNLDESNDAKRRRIARVEKKRNPPKGAKYIEGLENRLGRMESLLRLSGLLSETDSGKTDLGALERRLADKSTMPGTLSTKTSTASFGFNQPNQPSPANSAPHIDSHASPKTPNTTPDSQKESEADLDNLSDMMCSLVTNNCGETRYIGSSSGFSIFSPKGIQWVNEKTGDSSFQDMISSAYVDDNKWIYWKPEIFSDIFARRVFKPLPPKEEAMSLFKDYFENFNCLFPLFHEPTFMHLVERQYSRDPYEGSGWWASINVTLAIAHRLRVMSNLVPQEEDKKAWLYLKNAMGVLTELTMRNTDLLSVQALLGMSLFLQGTPNPQPTFFLVAAAIRLSHSIGLHKRGSGFGLNPVELEQRKRVFWIAYLLDKDICLRSGRPPVQDDDDMNVELPSEDPPDNIGNVPLADGKGKINLFRTMCTFATIESKVYRQLYSTKASRQSDGELLNTIGELDRELEEWKDSIPIDFRPEHEIKTTHRPLILHIVVLHFSYYNCLTTIHRMLILYFPISSLVTLFANILQNPQDARARSDVKLMGLVVNFLSMLVADESNGSVKRMLGVCSEFERIAKVVLDRAEKESQSKRKRRTGGDENHNVPTQRNGTSNGHSKSPSGGRQNATPRAPSFSRGFQGSTEQPTNHVSHDYFMPEANSQHHNSTPTCVADPSSTSTTPTTTTAATSATGGMRFGPAYDQEFGDLLPPDPTNPGGFTSGPSYSHAESMPIDLSSFQQPFVPQELWQMPMTLEWDWAEMANGFPYPNGDEQHPG